VPGIIGGSHAGKDTRVDPMTRYEPALTEIEIALRKEENPSENVQWAIERINRLQGEMENAIAKPLQCLCETCCMTVEQCRGQQLRQADSKRDKVLDVDTIGTLLNIVEKDCDRLTVLERQAYRKAKYYERELRQAGEP
jgi:hypothetical protein